MNIYVYQDSERVLLAMSTGNTSSLEDILTKTVSTIRAASGLASNDINFYKRLDTDILQAGEQSSERILSLINQITSSIESTDEEKITGEHIKETWKHVGNVLDVLLERSDVAFDSLTRSSSVPNAQDALNFLEDNKFPANSFEIKKRIEKPQNHFKEKVDNSESHPFRPLLSSKPHAIVPLEKSFELTEPEQKSPSHYPQPYETEILNQTYNPSILEKRDPIPSTDWSNTEAIWVDTLDGLKSMVDELRKCEELAVDLEHHDYRSYYGIVCLMQISSREKDWLIDTLAIRSELQVLNEVFTDPKIIKVFHGAFMDIIWLQRDFGLYVVSLFDTYHASRQLGFPKHGLAYLLERFAHFKTSKKYQLADWRIRPLTDPMKLYARADTHFLLNIYDVLRNMLLNADKMSTVLFESRNVARRRFEYSSYRPQINNGYVYSQIEKSDPWINLVYQYNLPVSKTGIVKTLYEWRDRRARIEDESPRFIMPNQLLISLASSSPTDVAGILRPTSIITEYVRKHSKELAELISKQVEENEQEDLELMNDISVQSDKVTDLSLDKISNYEKLYALAERISKRPINLSSTSTLFKNTFHPPQIMDYSNGKIVTHKLDVVPRLEIVTSHLNTFVSRELANKRYEDEDDENSIDVHSQEVTSKSETPPEEDSDAVNQDEIIVLKTRGKRNKKVPKAEKENGDATDYSKYASVMDQKDNRKREKKRPSSSFDPYSSTSEGPKPAKKQQKLQSGKVSSFSHRRNKKQ